MSTLWERDCVLWRGQVLHGPDGHWCADWDGLPISAFTPEYDCCTEEKTFLGRVCGWLYMRYWNFLDSVRIMKQELEDSEK